MSMPMRDRVNPDSGDAPGMAVQEQGLSEESPSWRGWLSYWQPAMLVVLTVWIGGMIVFLLMPQPRAEISLSPLPPDQLRVVVNASAGNGFTEADAISEDESVVSESRKPRKARKAAGKKKPAIPPVVNLNTASQSQLELLPGIGPKMAIRVIEYRKAHGPFSSPEQIMDVKGIGPRKFEKLRPYLKV